MQRRPNTQTVQWFLEIDASGQLDLDPKYQRRSVWNDEYRRFYIDTILRNFPSPAIYLEHETAAGKPTIYHVIDGKQRLESIIAFTKDEFHLGEYFEGEGYEDAYYSDLEEHLQNVLIDYVLSVENITRASEEEIKSAFERLNKNTAKLNKQELRKAQYDGAFITKMTNLAEHPFWSATGVATRARISRMLDVEYVSEIYLLTMKGVLDGNASVLDRYYSEFDSDIEDEDSTDTTYYQILEWFNQIDLVGTRWSNLGDLYGLWAAVRMAIESGQLPAPQEALDRLTAFESSLKADPTHPYMDAVRQGTNKDTQRKTRAEILSNVLTASNAGT